MGLRSLDPRSWLVLHSSYPSYAALRRARHQVYGSRSVRILPGPKVGVLSKAQPNVDQHRLAALEAARAGAGFLAKRYPMLFNIEPVEALRKEDDGWFIRAVTRKALPSTNLPEMRWTLLDEMEGGDDPMRVLGELLPDNLAIMFPSLNPDTTTTIHRFVAGSICTAGFWRLEDKIGLSLADIHLKGKVPQYPAKLQNPMDRFFSKLHPNKPVERNNYFFQVLTEGDMEMQVRSLKQGTLVPTVLEHGKGGKELRYLTELCWSHSTNGPETIFDQAKKGHAAPSPPKPTNDPAKVVMRTERQTLRRLPRSNAILFTIRTYLVPLTVMVQEPGVPARLGECTEELAGGCKVVQGGRFVSRCSVAVPGHARR